MENLLKVSKQIIHEIEENPTIQESRKTGMKVAVGYMLDEVYNQLLVVWCNTNLKFPNKEIETNFEIETGYSPNDVIQKQFESLNNYFISLNKN